MDTLKAVLLFWVGLDALLAVAGIVSVALSIIYRAPNLLLNITLSTMDLNAGMALGTFLLISFILSIPAVLQRSNTTWGLVWFNWVLVADGVFSIVIGTIVWFFSLRTRREYESNWLGLPQEKQAAIQNMFNCCGYWNGTSSGDFVAQTGFCADPTFAASNTTVGCITSITSFTDMTLETSFSTIYGYVAIILCLMLATTCLINERKLKERFLKIDEKRGSAFV